MDRERCMYLLVIFALALERVTSFVPLIRADERPSESISLATAPPLPILTDGIDSEHVKRKRGAISMGVDELAVELGGLGRALLAWDCYSIGVDPAVYFDPTSTDESNNPDAIQRLLPRSRRTQMMGKTALERLASLYDGSGGRIEGGVASLSHVAQSSDLTTKLLLRLRDGLEVETVIIPWNGVRSTLCISSQVGCRQGM